jgi:hypothetical protein
LSVIIWLPRRAERRAGGGALAAQTRRPIRHVFNFIGADPNTDWLASSGLVLDKKGFITTGGGSRGPLETSEPGVFAIGGVRSGSTKRVAAAVVQLWQRCAPIWRTPERPLSGGTAVMAPPPYWSGSRLISADGLQQSAQGLADHPRPLASPAWSRRLAAMARPPERRPTVSAGWRRTCASLRILFMRA